MLPKLTSNEKIEKRLKEFAALHTKGNKEWFSELCFCILTANSQAKRAISIQKELGAEGFLNTPQEKLAIVIKEHGHRFHNNKAKFIANARKFKNIKDIVCKLGEHEARKFIAKNIKGLGYKEASHFLRNVGYNNVAIIDRHILRFLHQEGLIELIPETITPKLYLKFEQILGKFKIKQSKLDLILWEKMTGQVLK